MVGYYKFISNTGKEEDVAINEINSDKDVYNFYHSEKSNVSNEIVVQDIDYTPVYKDNNLEKFYYLKNIIEKNIKSNLQIQEIMTPEVIKSNDKLEKLQKLFGLEKFNCNEGYILSPASDFGIFSAYEGKNFEEKDIPLRVYEFARCYRIEDKKKDVLKRPTSFYLPDIHCFMEKDTYKEVLEHLKLYEKILKEIKIPYFIALRISEQEYNNNKEKICNIAKELENNIIVNIVPSSIKYWESKFKYIYKDSNNDFIQLSTVQVDYRTSEIFNIKVKGNNAKIIHSSIGSMERLLYAFLDKKE